MYDARPERGIKRICLHCEAKFYDLTRFPILCPKCGTEYVEVVRPPPTPRRPRGNSPFGRDRTKPLEEAEDSGPTPHHAAESEEDGEEEEREADGDEDAEEEPDADETEE